jgi:hypothetical protein
VTDGDDLLERALRQARRRENQRRYGKAYRARVVVPLIASIHQRLGGACEQCGAREALHVHPRDGLGSSHRQAFGHHVRYWRDIAALPDDVLQERFGLICVKNRRPDRAVAPPRLNGEHNPNHKLTAVEVAEVRRLYRGHGIGARLARQFGVSKFQISLIIRHKNWP